MQFPRFGVGGERLRDETLFWLVTQSPRWRGGGGGGALRRYLRDEPKELLRGRLDFLITSFN